MPVVCAQRITDERVCLKALFWESVAYRSPALRVGSVDGSVPPPNPENGGSPGPADSTAS